MEEMLYGLDFSCKFIKWVMEYITTPRYQIAINRRVNETIRGRRRLRQGDLISPFLFMICMKFFTRVIQWVIEQYGFAYHTMCKGLKFNHLCFADDMLFFCKGKF